MSTDLLRGDDLSGLKNQYETDVFTRGSHHDVPACMYCKNEREKLVIAHNAATCLNRKYDESMGICKLICRKCHHVGGYDCHACGARETGASRYKLSDELFLGVELDESVNLKELPNLHEGQPPMKHHKGNEPCSYCLHERGIEQRGHNVRSCLNRKADEEAGLCKLVCEDCLAVGKYQCDNVIRFQKSKKSKKVYEFVCGGTGKSKWHVGEELGLITDHIASGETSIHQQDADDGTEHQTVRENLYHGHGSTSGMRCNYCMYSRNLEIRGHNIVTCKHRMYDEEHGLCTLVCEDCGTVGNYNCTACGGKGHYVRPGMVLQVE